MTDSPTFDPSTSTPQEIEDAAKRFEVTDTTPWPKCPVHNVDMQGTTAAEQPLVCPMCEAMENPTPARETDRTTLGDPLAVAPRPGEVTSDIVDEVAIVPPTPAREAHNTTPEQCMALVPSGFVCPGCGGTLEPIDTVDNAGTPTYWAGCNVCHKFSWGVSAETFDMARWLVDERKENFYHDLDASRESQIRGWTGIAGEIIRRTLSTRETEIAELREHVDELSEQLSGAYDELRCPECGCASQGQAEAAECGCGCIVCALDTGETLAQAFVRVDGELNALKERYDIVHDQRFHEARMADNARAELAKVRGELDARANDILAICRERDALKEKVRVVSLDRCPHDPICDCCQETHGLLK